MSVSGVKAELVALVTAVTGVNNVYAQIRTFSNISDVPITDDKVQWWEIYQVASEPLQLSSALVWYRYQFNIDGYYAWDHSPTANTSATFENLVESVIDAIMTDLDLGGTAEFGDFPNEDAENVGLPVVQFGIAQRRGVRALFHQARISIWVRDAATKTIQL